MYSEKATVVSIVTVLVKSDVTERTPSWTKNIDNKIRWKRQFLPKYMYHYSNWKKKIGEVKVKKKYNRKFFSCKMRTKLFQHRLTMRKKYRKWNYLFNWKGRSEKFHFSQCKFVSLQISGISKLFKFLWARKRFLIFWLQLGKRSCERGWNLQKALKIKNKNAKELGIMNFMHWIIDGEVEMAIEN